MSSIAATATPGAAPNEAQFRFRNQGLLPAIRKELRITAVSFRGHNAYVVKDPASLKYFRWGEKERFLASLLDGKKTGQQVLELMQARFLDSDYQPQHLELSITQFLQAGLLKTDGTLAQQIYLHQLVTTKKAKRKMLWLNILGKLVSFKITLFDPDLLLLRLNRFAAFLWSGKALALLLAMMAATAWILTRDTGSLASRAPSLFSWQNALILWIVMILVKVVHEFGHGLACKHFGGEVHEMGALFILFSPFLFCDATDSWVFKEKWKRMVVNFGGIYLELFLACIAGSLWALTAPGLFNQICFNVMFVCSIMTIFFNANPLMKFDGYYALSDFVEIPNLKERGDRALITRVAGFFTGGQGIARDPLVERFKWPILVYAVASYVWTYMVAYRILGALGKMLEPVGLDRIAQAAEALVLCGGIITPPIFVGMHVMKMIKADSSGQIRKKAAVKLAMAVLAIGGVFSIPVPFNIRTTCVMDGTNRIRVTAAAPGFVNQIAAREGQHVQAGQTLAVLENADLLNTAQKLKIQLEATQAEEAEAVSRQLDARIPSLRAAAKEIGTALQKFSRDTESLVIRSPVAGTVLTRELDLKKHTLLRTGDLLCEVLPDGSLEAILVLGEPEAAIVKKDQQVSFRLLSCPSLVYRGKVLEISTAPYPEFPHQSLSDYAGGTVPSFLGMANPKAGEASSSYIVAQPSAQIYKVRIGVDNPTGTLRPGMSGMLKIQCGHKPLGALLLRKVREMIRSDFRL